MKKSLLMVLALVASSCLAFAEASFDFTSSLPQGWTASVAPRGFEDRGAQFTENATLTLPGVSEVTQVTVICSANEANVNSIEVQVGETSLGTKVLPKENGQTLVFTSGTALDGDLKIVITRTKKSVWIKSVTIDGTYDSSSIEDDLTEGLDPDYVYEEPTKVVTTGEECSKTSYSFINNNVKVIANLGTKTDTYFGANAGTTLTFVTTRDMKGIVVDGFVRKAFTATSSVGTIEYESPMSNDLEQENVLVVKDINTNVLTLTCDKQLRCNEVRIYFEENPDVTIDMGGGEVDYSYYWEPEEAVTMNIVFDQLEYIDMTENLGYACTGLNFYSDTHEMQMVVFASTVEGTILPLGTYPVSDTYAANTVQASPGGDDYTDYATYIATDFETNDEGQELYNPYYVVSGELIVSAVEGGTEFALQAATYYGSTVNATCIYVANAVDTTSVAPKATKILRNGTLLLRSNGQTFTILGERF